MLKNLRDLNLFDQFSFHDFAAFRLKHLNFTDHNVKKSSSRFLTECTNLGKSC